MWREKIERFTTSGKFADPASATQLDSLEQALNLPLPSELRSLLLESDGVQGEYSVNLVWPASRIESDNKAFRANADFRRLYMSFDPLLFFADAGNGDQFAFAILDGQVRRSDVYSWNHEDDSRTWVAPSLGRYLEWWLSGRIRL